MFLFSLIRAAKVSKITTPPYKENKSSPLIKDDLGNI
jgi:hypothetical protein